MRTVTWGMPLLGVLLGLLFLTHPVWFRNVSGPVIAGIIGGLIGGGLGAALTRPWNLQRTYRSLNGDPAKELEIYLALEQDELISRVVGKSEGRFRRNAICKMQEDERMLLLFVAKTRFLYLPKDKIPAELIAEIRGWMSTQEGGTQC